MAKGNSRDRVGDTRCFTLPLFAIVWDIFVFTLVGKVAKFNTEIFFQTSIELKQ